MGESKFWGAVEISYGNYGVADGGVGLAQWEYGEECMVVP